MLVIAIYTAYIYDADLATAVYSLKLIAMKTIILFLSMISICTLGLAQDVNHVHHLKPGVVYIIHTPEGELIIDGMNPFTMKSINQAYLVPLDGSGIIPVNDPALLKRLNPYSNVSLDGIDPGSRPLKSESFDPNWNYSIEGIDPGPGQLKRRVISPNYLN